jgi:hypothetical protein
MTKLQTLWSVLKVLFWIAVLIAVLVAFALALTWIGALFIGLVVLAFYLQSRYFKRRDERRGWRMRSVKKGEWAYEEKKAGAWAGIPFIELAEPEKKSPHVIGIPRTATWETFPAWASTRRDEIISRIKSELKAPEYLFNEPDNAPPPLAADAPVVEPPLLPEVSAAKPPKLLPEA